MSDLTNFLELLMNQVAKKQRTLATSAKQTAEVHNVVVG